MPRLLLMFGLPGSGKSACADIICKQFEKKYELIRPEDWIPINLPDHLMKDFKVSAWETALSLTQEAITDNKDILLDQCNLYNEKINEIIQLAIKSFYIIDLVYINATKDNCALRKPELAFLTRETSYIDKFRQSLLKYKGLLNNFFVIENNGTQDELNYNVKLKFMN